MTAPRWTVSLIRRLATPHEVETLIGDVEEAHRARVSRRGSLLALALTSLEALDIAFMLIRRRLRLPKFSMTWLDLKLAMRMLVRYPVLSIIGTVSLAAAIRFLTATRLSWSWAGMWPRTMTNCPSPPTT